MPDYHRQIQRALERQKAAGDRKTALDRATARMPASSLTLGDIVDVVSELLADQRHDLVAHISRMFTLTKMSARDGDVRDKNLHMRLTAAEFAIRRLEKGGRR